ncbi:uncharacterized protein LOC27206951 [Drosophila simulans]|uniref:uncharacterized protein LOC27206951 n=1 Tax=Drosophila simulans TaxID=7240 RepID=UPI00078AEAE3|nr:uncharacterized protein LOC27206951 [Drosophila simulans]KMZ02491.1 uncharacterized protein Dsimw501_GD27101 [Drosophila simulans]
MEALAELSISTAQEFIVRVSIYTTGMAKILLISVCFFFASTEALSLPSHNCSDYFTYGIDANGSYIGIFTADEAGVQKLNFSARFIFHGAKNQVSPINPYPTTTDAIRNIENGYRGQAFVQFTNSTSELPTLFAFVFNGKVLCRSSIDTFRMPYSTMGTKITIKTFQPIRKLKDTRPIMHPIFPQIEPKIIV